MIRERGLVIFKHGNCSIRLMYKGRQPCNRQHMCYIFVRAFLIIFFGSCHIVAVFSPLEAPGLVVIVLWPKVEREN